MERDREYKMSDVVSPSTSRTIRRIPINRKQLERDRDEEEEEKVEEYVRPRRTASHRPLPPKGSSVFTKFTIIAVVVVSIIAIAAAVSLAYSKGTLSIAPKQIESSINLPFSATPSGEGLTYTTITASETSMEVVAAKPGSFFQSKARGDATITNTSPEEQQLVINTRLETSSGKIFRLSKPIVVPAGKKVSVPIVADESGAEWNITKAAAGKMTIPGFKGTKRFEQFYAELDADMTGGFSGTRNVVDEATLKETRDRLVSSVTELVRAKLKAQVDANSLYYETLTVISIEDLPQIAKGTNQSQISVKGNGLAYVFDRTALTKTLGANEVKKLGADSFKALGIEKAVITSKTPLKFSPTATLNLTAVGNITIVGDVPLETLKNELVGIKVADLNEVLKKYDGISKASAKISPFWKKAFPANAQRIHVEIEE